MRVPYDYTYIRGMVFSPAVADPPPLLSIALPDETDAIPAAAQRGAQLPGTPPLGLWAQYKILSRERATF